MYTKRSVDRLVRRSQMDKSNIDTSVVVFASTYCHMLARLRCESVDTTTAADMSTNTCVLGI